MLHPVVTELRQISEKARVFVSMPYIEGLTPRIFGDLERVEAVDCGECVPRRHGIFRMDEAPLSPLDHGGLYGDAVFEGILVINGRIFTLKEHLERLYVSAERMMIRIPYDMATLARFILRTVQAVGFSQEEKGYLRPVLTRGFGNLGIHPSKCVAPTFYCIASTIRLYPPEKYEVGIEISIARNARRATRQFVDPNIKSNNYLNNIFALIETKDQERLETLMLTPGGAVAEASADNIFVIERLPGWLEDPSQVTLKTPSPEYCLVGITRNIVMMEARRAGYRVEEVPDMLPIDMVGAEREVFLTGTGAGLMPVIGVKGVPVGDGLVGPITRNLLEALQRNMADPRFGLALNATDEDLEAYLARPSPIV